MNLICLDHRETTFQFCVYTNLDLNTQCEKKCIHILSSKQLDYKYNVNTTKAVNFEMITAFKNLQLIYYNCVLAAHNTK